jgi:alpha-tubulin suppressor-like RCC1 family protein
MSGRICTRYRDDDGLDVGCHLLSKEYMIENYPSLVDQAKMPGLWLWGYGNNGQLGDNTTTNKSSPVQTISHGTTWRSVESGKGSATAAIKTDGSLWLWGSNSGGQLGTNSRIGQSSPVQTVSGGTNWRAVSVSSIHSAAIKTDGTLWTWGSGADGRLGNNAIVNQSSPIQTISGGTNWKSVNSGAANTVAIKTDGTLWLWGNGACGQLGNNAIVNQSSPIQTISGGTNWRNAGVYNHVVAIKTDGSLWVWGNGENGRLGNDSTTDVSSPVQTISGGTNWRAVSVNFLHSTATKTDGTLWLWGSNDRGRLGNGGGSASSPVQTISGGTNWRMASAGVTHTAAIKIDGTLWAWGRATCGTLGNNIVADQSSPVQTISGGTNWRSVSAGGGGLSGHTAAIKDLGDF